MKNLANYSDPDKIGSTHWFRTLVSQAKHMGEFINNEDNVLETNYRELVIEYGGVIKGIMMDLIEWQETNKPLYHEII